MSPGLDGSTEPDDRLPTWGVVATVAEPPEIVATMALHHVRLGASEVNIFLDRPSPETVALLRPFPQVRCTLCDDDYWKGQRPKTVEQRQSRNATRAYRRSGVDWLLHCDADEFVGGRTPLAIALSKVDPEVEVVRLPVAERVGIVGERRQRLFEGPFRRSLDTDNPSFSEIYGEEMKGFLNGGLVGHRLGKVLARTGRGLKIGLHYARRSDAHRKQVLPDFELPKHVLLHYDGLTTLHYLNKFIGLERKNSSHERRVQAMWLNELADHSEALHTFVSGLRYVTPEQAQALRDLGVLVEDVELPDAAVDELCPAARIDPLDFDAQLRAKSHGRLDKLPVFD